MIAIIHLTDFHFTEKAINLELEERAEALSKAICSHSPGITEFYIIHTGDIASTGLSEEYTKGKTFFNSLFKSISSWRKNASIRIIFTPGNHDCNFSQKSPIRSIILQSEKLDFDQTEVVSEILKPQEGFFNFINDDIFESSIEPFIWKRFVYSFMGKKIAFDCYNTAWGFQLNQKPGTLKFPCEVIERISADTADYIFSLLHHPLHWFEPENLVQFRDILEENSDMIFLGHEHRDDQRRIINKEEQGTEYIHGSALFPHDGGRSGFNLFHLNIDSRTVKNSTFFWDDQKKIYISSHDFESLKYRNISNKSELHSEFRIATHFREKLDDIEIDLTTGNKASLGLSDIYVYPDFVEDDISKAPDPARKKKTIYGCDIVDYIKNNRRVVIEGTEKSGRTALCKQLFKEFHTLKIYPIFIDCKNLSSSDFSNTKKIITDAFHCCYENSDLDIYYQLTQKIIILDNYHIMEMNKGKKAPFINKIKDIFTFLVIISEPFSILHTAGENLSFITPIVDFKYLNIRLLGPKKRHEIVTRWYAKDNIFFNNSSHDANCIREAERTLDRIVGSNLIPPHPSYILLVLQGHINGTTSINEFGAYGYFYEMLIWRTLLEGYSHAEMGEKINILSEMAYYLFSNNLMKLSKNEAIIFARKYETDYMTSIDITNEIEKFVSQRILHYDEEKSAYFKRDYLYYYFLAKYLAKGLGSQIRKENVSSDIRDLVSCIHSPRNSSVLMFLSYLSKDDIIIEEILKHAQTIFIDHPLFNFDAWTKKIESLNHIPTIKKDRVNPNENMEKKLDDREEDFHNGSKRETAWHKDNRDGAPCDKWIQDANLPMKIAIAIKTMQVMGQLVTNF